VLFERPYVVRMMSWAHQGNQTLTVLNCECLFFCARFWRKMGRI